MKVPTQALNPFMPGAGKQPRDLVGRDRELGHMQQIITRTQLGLIDRGCVYSGLRGVGKTVLLLQCARMVSDAGMVAIQVEADDDCTRGMETLFRELEMAALRVRTPGLLQRLGEVFEHVRNLTVGFGSLKVEVGTASKPEDDHDLMRLQILIEDMASELGKDQLGLFLFIDEFQDMAPELMAMLLTVQHRMGQRNLPFFIIGAGLPNLPGVLTRVRSYAERLFDYHTLGMLDEQATAEGFSKPAEQSGRRFTDDALRELVRRSRGYPYFIQAYGSATWNASDSDPIPLDAVRKGLPEAWKALDQGLYVSRWQRASETGRDYLAAMASIGGSEVSTSDVAAHLGRSVSAVGPIRAQLIELGLIYAPRRGKVAFTVPGMDDYIARAVPVVVQPYDEAATIED
ncbi:MAG: ATP-binding protein [Bifidobacterium sp.]|nr:ATP-binding protein [Bifidobacterium sp.]